MRLPHRGALRSVAVSASGSLLLLVACHRGLDPRFSSPATTFHTYQQALRAGDRDLLWACYSRSFQENVSGGRDVWEAQWNARAPEAVRSELGREIVEEKEINGSIGYLLFAESSLPSAGESRAGGPMPRCSRRPVGMLSGSFPSVETAAALPPGAKSPLQP